MKLPLWMFRKPSDEFGEALKETAKELFANEQI
jgi:hypothetical protein